MTSVVFSDDEDVSRHASTLDNIHGIIVEHMKPCVNWEDGCDRKENQPRAGAHSSIENDPIYRQVLAEKRRPLGDVFILPMARPSKTQDEYQFVTDSEPMDDKIECPSSVESPSSSATLISCNPLRSASRTNSRPASSTPRIYSRKRQRIRKLLDAELDNRSSQSDDDQEFIPELTVSTYESLCKVEPVLTMNLRPRKGLWTAEDDLPLSDIRQILYINSLENTSADSVTDVCMTEKQKPQENGEADSCDEFAFLPSSSSFAPVEQLTPKRSRFTSSKGSSRRFECRHKGSRSDLDKCDISCAVIIGAFAMDDKKKLYRPVLLLQYRFGRSTKEAHRLLQKTMKGQAPSRTTYFICYLKFDNGDESRRSDVENIQLILANCGGARLISVRELSALTHTPKSTVHDVIWSWYCPCFNVCGQTETC